MKRFQNRFRQGAGEFQAASMSDIAFLLLIFFIITTTFALEEGIPLVLPGRQATIAKVKQKDILEIKAYPDGSVVVGGEKVGVREVRSRVASRLAANRELIVVVVTHPDAEYGLMVELLDEIRLADCRRISLKTMDAPQE